MGDVRFEQPYQRVAEATDRVAAIRSLSSEEVVMALAGASRERDPLLANILATEALNRTRRANIVLENIAEGIVAVDAERRVTYVNGAALELLGYARDELLGRDLHALVHFMSTGEPMPEEACVLVQTLATGEVAYQRDHGESFRRKDGSSFIVELTSAPVHDDGAVVGAVLVVSDVTAQIEAEVAIGRVAAIVEHSADAIITLATDGTITHANQAVHEVLGHDPQQLPGQHILTLVPDEAHAQTQQMLVMLRNGDPVRQVDLPHKHKDGRTLSTALTAFPVYDGSGRVVAISGIIRDVTRRRREQAELAAAHARERELHASVRYRLTTLLPALAWGLGTVILLRTLVLLWFVSTPNNRADLIILGTTTVALLVGGFVGVGVYFWRRAQARREHPPSTEPR